MYFIKRALGAPKFVLMSFTSPYNICGKGVQFYSGKYLPRIWDFYLSISNIGTHQNVY